jgi:hypothetical protein
VLFEKAFGEWLDGTWERLRFSSRPFPQPTAEIIDSQSLKTISVGGSRGYDGAKKIRGPSQPSTESTTRPDRAVPAHDAADSIVH